MILDRIENAKLYCTLHPSFAAAFEFLRRKDLATLPTGRHEIDGARIYALIEKKPGRGRTGAKMEVHRKHIDIQFAIAGTDEIGWKATGQCRQIQGEFDVEKDRAFYSDSADAWIALPPGTFAIFFPEDAHAPLAGAGELHKAVVKVAVQEETNSSGAVMK